MAFGPFQWLRLHWFLSRLSALGIAGATSDGLKYICAKVSCTPKSLEHVWQFQRPSWLRLLEAEVASHGKSDGYQLPSDRSDRLPCIEGVVP